MSDPYLILKEPFTEGRVITLSDLHVGNPNSRYMACWNAMLHAVEKGGVSWVMINGDLTDRKPYAACPENPEKQASEQKTHEDILRGMLDCLMAAGAASGTKVTVILGNHDQPKAYQDLLNDVKHRYPDRFSFDHLLLLGDDSLFAHGDFSPARSLNADAVAEVERKSQAERALREKPYTRGQGVAYILQRMQKSFKFHDEELKALDPHYRDRPHLFFGHVHPLTHADEEMVDGKHIHITGPAMSYCPSLVLEATFKNGCVVGVEHLYEEEQHKGQAAITKGAPPSWVARQGSASETGWGFGFP